VIVANDAQHGAYEIAHEALLSSWSTLQSWLEQTAADHVVRRRLEQAAAEWERAAHPRDVLWGRRRLAEARTLDRATLPAREAAFLAASRRALVRTWSLLAAGAVVLASTAVVTGLVLHARAQRELERVIAGQLAEGDRAIADARQLAHQRDDARTRAFGKFDAREWGAGEDAWSEAERLGAQEAAKYRAATRALDGALALAPERASLREQLADLLFERVQRAERDRTADVADELLGRLAAYDDGSRRAVLDAPAHLEISAPAGTEIWQERGAARTLVGRGPRAKLAVSPGASVLAFEAPGRAPARLPLLVAHGETVRLAVAPPPADVVPANMIYVPPGRFLFGSADSSDLRRGFLNSPPMHEVTTGAYLIARREVTYGEWIEFLDALPPDERKARSPSLLTPQSSVTLVEVAPKRWRYTFVRGTKTYVADMGERIHYQKRTTRIDQDWLKFPVAAISFEDAVAYATWLDRTHRLTGAHVCDDHEWERAARGADGRTFPTGEALAPDDANIDITYGREPEAFGPDEVGSHPRSRSPVGADDMAGNVWEWTRSVETPGTPIARGGGWYNEALNARATNREPGEPTQRYVWLGIRMCANPPLTQVPEASMR